LKLSVTRSLERLLESSPKSFKAIAPTLHLNVVEIVSATTAVDAAAVVIVAGAADVIAIVTVVAEIATKAVIVTRIVIKTAKVVTTRALSPRDQLLGKFRSLVLTHIRLSLRVRMQGKPRAVQVVTMLNRTSLQVRRSSSEVRAVRAVPALRAV
jgi:hypothetical protein